MAFNLNTLEEYVDNSRKEFLNESIFTVPSISLLNLQLGVKYKSALNLLETDPVLQERTCGFDPQGSATFTQETIEVAPYTINMELCQEDLRKYWMNTELKTKAGFEVLPYDQAIVKDIIKNVKLEIEKVIWQGDTDNSDLIDGLVKRIIAAGTNSYSASDQSIYDRVRSTYLTIDPKILNVAEIFVGVDTYRALCQEMVTKNLYHYSADVNTNNMSLVFPGTDTVVRAITGLNGTNMIIAGNPKYMFIGMDMSNDEEEFDLFFDKAERNFKFVESFNLGTQIVFGDTFVYNNGQA